jgi:hypothetical protein
MAEKCAAPVLLTKAGFSKDVESASFLRLSNTYVKAIGRDGFVRCYKTDHGEAEILLLTKGVAEQSIKKRLDGRYGITGGMSELLPAGVNEAQVTLKVGELGDSFRLVHKNIKVYHSIFLWSAPIKYAVVGIYSPIAGGTHGVSIKEMDRLLTQIHNNFSESQELLKSDVLHLPDRHTLYDALSFALRDAKHYTEGKNGPVLVEPQGGPMKDCTITFVYRGSKETYGTAGLRTAYA